MGKEKWQALWGNPILSENPQHNQPDYRFKNVSIWQHVKDISLFHRDVQFGLAAKLQALLAHAPYPLFGVEPGPEAHPSSSEALGWDSRKSLTITETRHS